MKNELFIPTIEETMTLFLSHQKEHCSFSTYSNRQWTLNKLRRYLKQRNIHELNQLTREVILQYEQEKPPLFKSLGPLNHPVSPRTLKSDTTNIRVFLSFLYNRQLLLADLSLHLLHNRSTSTLPRPLPPKVIEEWFSLCDLTSPLGLRDRAFFELAYGSGLRSGEILALKVNDLDLTQAQLLVQESKNGEARLVPLTRISCHHLRAYLTEARPWLPKCPKTEEYLWLNSLGRRLTGWDIRERVGKYGARLSCGTHITLHKLRHSCATHLLQGGASIRQVQALLGHRAINSTQLYTHVAITDLKAVHRKCHPRRG